MKCAICMREGYYTTCPFLRLKRNLRIPFAAGGHAYYEVYSPNGILACYTNDGILCGRLIIKSIDREHRMGDSEKDYTYIWQTEGARVELYFSKCNSFEYERPINEIILDLNDISCTAYDLLSKHRVYFQ